MTTYKDAGVDIEAGEEAVDRIRPLVRKTFTPGVMTDIGAFGAFFDPDFAGYRHPVLVSSVDGVGTKLKVAFRVGRHDTVGHDLVNHCVNDIAVCGAQPLFFLDYFSTGRLDPDTAFQVVEGFTAGCLENGCALIGGETAEMPDIYTEGEYDLAGMIVGVVEKDQIIDGSSIRAGHRLIGFPSTGLHTNGYSLARHVLFGAFEASDTPEQLGGRSIGDVLLAVHRSYLNLIRSLTASNAVDGLVHITGGGIPGNTRRVIPEGLDFDVDYSSWTEPGIFSLIRETGNVPEDDMRRTFNLGIGLIAAVAESRVEEVLDLAASMEEKAIPLGRVIEA